MKRPPRITYETVRRLAFQFPNVQDGTSYGTPALKVKGNLLVRLKEDPDVLVVKMPFDRRDELLAGDPEKYFITDHYREYEWVLVRLSKVNEAELRDLLGVAYRAASPARSASKPRRP
ncbi:MAG TPA: MmcQ/YjbR family DNA-binding protein [Candidatus Acidoferrales bacterium]|nr:MmcQ/YjbR family DNA-binding protein [Candidatus Acidoferrales bacterium]